MYLLIEKVSSNMYNIKPYDVSLGQNMNASTFTFGIF